MAQFYITSAYPTSAGACGDTTGFINAYTSDPPTVGNFVFTDPGEGDVFIGNGEYIGFDSLQSVTPTYAVEISIFGEITDVVSCIALPPPPPPPTTTTTTTTTSPSRTFITLGYDASVPANACADQPTGNQYYIDAPDLPFATTIYTHPVNNSYADPGFYADASDNWVELSGNLIVDNGVCTATTTTTTTTAAPPPPPPVGACTEYEASNQDLVETATIQYNDCDGVSQEEVIGPDASSIFCAEEGTVITISGDVSLTDFGPCPPPPPGTTAAPPPPGTTAAPPTIYGPFYSTQNVIDGGVNEATACSDSATWPFYADDTFDNIGFGTTIYTDSAGETVWVGNGSYYGISSTSFTTATRAMVVQSTGFVSGVSECGGTTTAAPPPPASATCHYVFVDDLSSYDPSQYGLRWNHPTEGLKDVIFNNMLGSPDTWGGASGTSYGVCSSVTPSLWDSVSNETQAIGVATDPDVIYIGTGGSCTDDNDCNNPPAPPPPTPPGTTAAPPPPPVGSCLPESGNPLSFNDLNVGLGNSGTAELDLETAAIGFSIPNRPHEMDEFYGLCGPGAPPPPATTAAPPPPGTTAAPPPPGTTEAPPTIYGPFYSSANVFDGGTNSTTACETSATWPFYTDASSVENIGFASKIYTDAAGDNDWVGNGSYYGISSTSFTTPTRAMVVNSGGNVTGVIECGGAPPPPGTTEAPPPPGTTAAPPPPGVTYYRFTSCDALPEVWQEEGSEPTFNSRWFDGVNYYVYDGTSTTSTPSPIVSNLVDMATTGCPAATTNPPPPAISLDSSDGCAGGAGTGFINLTATGGSGNYKFHIDTTPPNNSSDSNDYNGTQNASGLSNATYFAAVIDLTFNTSDLLPIGISCGTTTTTTTTTTTAAPFLSYLAEKNDGTANGFAGPYDQNFNDGDQVVMVGYGDGPSDCWTLGSPSTLSYTLVIDGPCPVIAPPPPAPPPPAVSSYDCVTSICTQRNDNLGFYATLKECIADGCEELQ